MQHLTFFRAHLIRCIQAAIFVVGLLIFSSFAFAAGPYAPGETLDPACSPGATDCTVVLVSYSTSTGNFGVGTTSPYAKLSVVGEIVGAYFTGTTTATSTFGGQLNIQGAGTSTASNGFNITSGCFAINGTCISGGAGGGSGTVTSVDISGGSTGLSFGGGPITSSGSFTLSGTLAVANGGTGQTSFGQGWLSSNGTTLTSSTSPTVNYITATSTTASSTFAGGISTTRLSTSATSTMADIVSQSIIPNGDALYDLGSPTNRFRDLYLSTASLHLESNTGETGTARQWKFGIDTGDGTNTGTSTGFFRIQEGNSPMFYLNHAGQIGVGVTDPRSRLHVQGNAWLTLFGNPVISSSGTTVTGTNFLYGYNKLSVGDQILADGEVRTVTAIASNTSLTIDSPFTLPLSNDTYQTQQPIARFDNSAGATKFIIGPGGNVGIGDLNPTGLLSVGAGDAFSVNPFGVVTSGTWNGTAIGVQYGGTGQTSFGQGWLSSNGTTLTSSTSPTVNYIVATSTTASSTFASAVGIGTSTPSGRLAITGAGTGTGRALVVADSSNAEKFIITDAGNLTLAGTAFVGSTSGVQFGNNGIAGSITGFLAPTADGVFRFGDSAGGGSPRIILGSAGSGFVSLLRNGAGLDIRLGDNTGYGSTTAANFNATSNIASSLRYASTTAISVSGPAYLDQGFVINSGGSPVFQVSQSGYLYTPIGTALTPTHSFIADTNTGIFGTGSDVLGFSTAGLERMTIDATGNVGIGTSTPYARLSVVGQVVANYFTSTSTTATSTFAAGIETTYLNLTGSSATSTFANGITLSNGCYAVNGVCIGTLGTSVDLTSEVAGVLPVANGGTGWAAIYSGAIPYGNDAGALATTTVGTNGQALALVNGVPTWVSTSTLSTITGTLSVAKGGTGQTSFAQGWLHSDGSTLTSSTSPTVNYIVATSTTATSTFAAGVQTTSIALTGSATSTAANGIDLADGCFSVDGVCVGDTSDFVPYTGATADVDLGSNDITTTGIGTFGLAPASGYRAILGNQAESYAAYFTDTSGGSANEVWIANNNQAIYTLGDVFFGNTELNSGSTLTAGLANITKLSNLTSNGFVKTSGGDGTLSIDTTTYLSGTVGVANGGTGATTFGQGWIHSAGGTNTLTSSTSPTVNYIVATSTTATSTFAGGLTIEGSGFVYNYSTNKVGIGTATPDELLSVESSTTGASIKVASAANTNALMYFAQGGTVNAYFGTVAPADSIITGSAAGDFAIRSVNKNILFSTNNGASVNMALTTAGKLGIGTTTANWLLQEAGTRPFFALSDTSAATNFKHWTVSSQGGNFYFATSSDLLATSTIPAFMVNSNGNFAIGTTTLSSKLNVQGDALAFNFIATSTTATSTFMGGLNVANGALQYDFGSGITSIDNLEIGALSFDTDAGIVSWADLPVTSTAVAGLAQSYSAQIDGNPLLTVYGESDGAGSVKNLAVGIGTTTPYARLSVAGSSVSTTTFAVAPFSTSQTADIMHLYSKGGLGAVFTANGRLGLGTTTPNWLFQVASTSLGQKATFVLSDPSAGTNAKHWFQSSQGGNFYIGTSSDLYATTTYMTIVNGGRVGIGTTTPTSKLHINQGNITGATVNAGLTLDATYQTANTAQSIDFLFNGDTNKAARIVVPVASNGGGGEFAFYTTTNYSTVAPSEKLRINMNGNVGIGTTTPNWLLQEAGTRPFFALSDTSAGTNLKHWTFSSQGGSLFFATSSDLLATSTMSAFIINANGNVAFGTTTLNSKLTVHGDVAAFNFIATSTTATSTFMGGLSVANGALQYDFGSGITSIDNLEMGALSFDTDAGIVTWWDLPVTSAAGAGTVESYVAQIDGTPLLTVYGESDGAGSVKNLAVGIGTTTPYARLSVSGSSVSTTTFAIAPFSSSQTADLAHFYSTTGLGAVVTARGRFGLGTTTPNWQFQIASTTAGQKAIFALSDPSAAANLKHWTLSSQSGSLFFATSSDLLATSTVSALSINTNGGIFAPSLRAVDGNAVCITAFELTNPGATSCTGSSIRFKQDVETLGTGFALDTLKKLRVVSFNYKDGHFSPEDGARSYGLIAEEVSLIDKALVDFGYDGQAQTLKFEKITGLTVQAVQELASTTASFDIRLANLETANTGMLATILSGFETLGVKVTSSFAWFKNVVVETLTIGSETKPTAITVYDKDGKAGCMTIDDVTTGAFKVIPGVCDSTTIATSTTPVIKNEITLPVENNSESQTETETSTTTSATSTDSIIETATTTEAVNEDAPSGEESTSTEEVVPSTEEVSETPTEDPEQNPETEEPAEEVVVEETVTEETSPEPSAPEETSAPEPASEPTPAE